MGYIKFLGTLCIFLYIYNSSNCHTSRWVGKQSGLESCLWYPQISTAVLLLSTLGFTSTGWWIPCTTTSRLQDLCTNQTGMWLPLSSSQPGMLAPERPHSYLQKGAPVGALAFQRCQWRWISLSPELSNLLFSSDKPLQAHPLHVFCRYKPTRLGTVIVIFSPPDSVLAGEEPALAPQVGCTGAVVQLGTARVLQLVTGGWEHCQHVRTRRFEGFCCGMQKTYQTGFHHSYQQA